eukprot:1161282-Pelagomonas_calceolata.AAC.17
MTCFGFILQLAGAEVPAIPGNRDACTSLSAIARGMLAPHSSWNSLLLDERLEGKPEYVTSCMAAAVWHCDQKEYQSLMSITWRTPCPQLDEERKERTPQAKKAVCMEDRAP